MTTINSTIASLRNLINSTNLETDISVQLVVADAVVESRVYIAKLFDSNELISQITSINPDFEMTVYRWLSEHAAGHLPEPAPEETTYDSLLCAAREELKDAIRELHVTDEDDDDIRDRLTEIVDSNVPFINHKLFEVFANGGISYEMDDEGLIDGVSDVIKIMQARIYEELSNDLYGELEGLIQEYNDELEDEAETCGYGDDDE